MLPALKREGGKLSLEAGKDHKQNKQRFSPSVSRGNAAPWTHLRLVTSRIGRQ